MENFYTETAPELACAWEERTTVAGVTTPTAYAWAPASMAVVLGLSQKAEVELDLNALNADGVKIIRRSSGGGAVLLGSGVLCFGVIHPVENLDAGIRESFRLLTSHVVDACAAFGVTAVTAGISDLSAPEPGNEKLFKIAGCAQLRKKHAVLVHGSILLDADISVFSKYLKFPSEVPDYRADRTHADFCRNLNALTEAKVSLATVTEEIRRQALRRNWDWREIPDEPDAETQALLEAKYLREGWNLRRERLR
jgi:lipoate-protein ligase A